MSEQIEAIILPFLLELGRDALFVTSLIGDCLGYSRRQMYNYFVEMERRGLLTRKPRGHVWRLA